MARAFRSVAPWVQKERGRIVRNGVGRLKPLRPCGEGYVCLSGYRSGVEFRRSCLHFTESQLLSSRRRPSRVARWFLCR